MNDDVKKYLSTVDTEALSVLAKHVNKDDIDMITDTYYIGLAIRDFMLKDMENRQKKGKLYRLLGNDILFRAMLLSLVPLLKSIAINICKLIPKLRR